jgi:hypothetical protein
MPHRRGKVRNESGDHRAGSHEQFADLVYPYQLSESAGGIRMIDHIWRVVCAKSSTDRETNNLSLFDVLEQVNVLGPVPEPGQQAALPMPYELVSLWARSNPAQPEESTARIKLLGPNSATLLTQDFQINLNPFVRVRTQMRALAFPLSGQGRYVFVVEIRRTEENWEVVAKIPVQLETVAQFPVGAPAT